VGLRHWSYVAVLVFCLIGTLPLVRAYRLTVFRRPLRLLAAIVLAAAPFLVWDLWATRAGHWHFDAAQTLPPRIAGLPLEEIAFFVVVPLASILAFEAVRAVRGERDGLAGRGRATAHGPSRGPWARRRSREPGSRDPR
jgi:lycopene cyclase domain-containing protein